MFGLPRRATMLWLVVISSASAVVVTSALAAAADAKWSPIALLFVLASAIAESFKVYLPTSRTGDRMHYSLGATVEVAALVVLPLPWAVLVGALGVALGGQTVWFKRAYNSAATGLAVALAGLVWSVSPDHSRPSDVASIPWAIGAVLLYFVVSTGFTSCIVALATAMPIGLTWRRSNRNTWPAFLGMLFLGVLIAILWNLSAWTVALAAIPLTAVYYALRNTVGLETETIGALFNLADILDARDPYTHGHSLRVGEYAEKLALAMGVSDDQAHMIFLAGRLHDIGKCAIKNEVLLKPGALNDEEREHMCIHPAVGSSMLASFSLFGECAKFVRGHHERFDGKGYPDKLAGEAIPIGARIIAVADAYDAMTTTRPYRKALPLAEAYRRLSEGGGTQWDPRAVTGFLKLLDSHAIGQPDEQPEPLQLPLSSHEEAKAA